MTWAKTHSFLIIQCSVEFCSSELSEGDKVNLRIATSQSTNISSTSMKANFCADLNREMKILGSWEKVLLKKDIPDNK